jgi:hypothetical protein
MNATKLRDTTNDQLVERFVEIAVQQNEALLRDEIAKFNKLFSQMNAVDQELRSRSGDQRRLLLRLYDHPNVQVRLKAAKRTLAIAPDDARAVLESIASSRKFPQAGEAGMSRANLDSGVFKPR